MQHLSIDIETCGLDPTIHPMIEFGAVWDDGVSDVAELKRFRALVVRRDGNYHINSYCIGLHQDLFREIETVDWNRMATGAYETSDGMTKGRAVPTLTSIVCVVEELGSWLRGWLDALGVEGKINVSGKNYGSFDSRWVGSHLAEAGILVRRRLLDPAMFYAQPGDDRLPNLTECCSRAGIELDKVAFHTAIYDAELVVKLIRGGL